MNIENYIYILCLAEAEGSPTELNSLELPLNLSTIYLVSRIFDALYFGLLPNISTISSLYRILDAVSPSLQEGRSSFFNNLSVSPVLCWSEIGSFRDFPKIPVFHDIADLPVSNFRCGSAGIELSQADFLQQSFAYPCFPMRISIQKNPGAHRNFSFPKELLKDPATLCLR